MCIPASLNISTIKSDAPFITFGWSVNASIELTKPVSLMQDFIFDKSESQAFLAWAKILNPHLFAAKYPCSIVRSLPILPFINLPSSEIEIWPEI